MIEYYRFKTVHDLFVKGLIDEAREHLTELQRHYVALCNENTSCKMQLQEYEDILYLSKNLILDRNFYWLVTGSIKQGPFCKNCYENQGLLVRLTGDSEKIHCSSCQSSFKPPSAKPALQSDTAMLPRLDRAAHDSCDPSHSKKAKVIPFNR